MFTLFAIWCIGDNNDEQQKEPSSYTDYDHTLRLSSTASVHLFHPLVPLFCSPSLNPILRSNSHLNCLTSRYNHHNILNTG